MNKLHVAIVHDQIIPAKHYGGTERVLVWLTKALVALGHKVSLIVPKGSKLTIANIVERPKGLHLINDLIPEDIDLVHTFASIHEDLKKPKITTIHGNGQVGERFHPNTVFLSRNHAKRHNSDVFVYNGLDPLDYPDFQEKENFCYFLAKAKWKVKNVTGAIKIANKAKVPLKIIGGWRPSFSSTIKWQGMLGGEKKNQILKEGSALLFPIRWHEPFGLALIEALYTGAPVFGTPYGSLPEIVTEECGFLSTNSAELANKLNSLSQYDKKVCKKHVLDKFTNASMAQNYLNLYEQVINGRALNKDEPKTLASKSPETLLDFF